MDGSDDDLLARIRGLPFGQTIGGDGLSWTAGHNGVRMQSAQTPVVPAAEFGDGTEDRPDPHNHDLLAVDAARLEQSRRLAEELAGALRALQIGAAPATPAVDVLEERVAQLEMQVERNHATREQLLQLISQQTDDQQLQALVALLGAWSQRPNDLLVMVKIAEQSTQLVDAIKTLVQLRRALLGE